MTSSFSTIVKVASAFATDAIAPIHTGFAPPVALPDEHGLPEIPRWLIHALAGSISFMLIASIILFLTQFPGNAAWPAGWRFKRRHGYNQVHQEDYESHPPPRNVATTTGQDSRDAVGRRKRKELSIDTSVQYHGLGIAVPGNEKIEQASPFGHVHYGGESRTRTRGENRPWLTAPLPSLSAFFRSPRAASESDVGRGESVASPTSSPDIHRPRSAQNIGGFLGSVDDLIGRAADRLARAFHDQAYDPEEGLVLPVREVERAAYSMDV